MLVDTILRWGMNRQKKEKEKIKQRNEKEKKIVFITIENGNFRLVLPNGSFYCGEMVYSSIF